MKNRRVGLIHRGQSVLRSRCSRTGHTRFSDFSENCGTIPIRSVGGLLSSHPSFIYHNFNLINMAFVGWFNKLRAQKEGEDAIPKILEPTVTSLPSSGWTSQQTTPPFTPKNELAESPFDSQETLGLEKRPEFGRLASWRGALILLVTSGSQFLDNVFMTSANMALSSIQEEFDVSSGNLQWMISAYTLAFGGFLLLAGVLSDR